MATETQAPGDLPSAETTAPARQAGKPARSRQRTLLILLVASFVGVGIKPAFEWWRSRQTAFYKSACQDAVQSQAWTRLESVAAAWLKWDPGSDDALLYSAEAAQQLGRPQHAVDLLGRVHDDYHGALPALAIRAELLFSDLNRPFDAEATWQRMLRINPRADTPRQRLIYFDAMTLQRAKLLTDIHDALQWRCEPPEAYVYLIMLYDLNFSDGLLRLTKWRSDAEDNELLEVAQAVYAAKQTVDRQMATFGVQTVAPGDKGPIDRCLQKYPSNLEVLALHIDRAIFDGDTETVSRLITQCPAAAEQDGRFWRYRGWLLTRAGRYAEAARALQIALQIHPYDWNSRWLLADALRHLGQVNEADDMARVATAGKELMTELLERRNARDISPELAARLHAYLKQTGPAEIVSAIELRLGDSSSATTWVHPP